MIDKGMCVKLLGINFDYQLTFKANIDGLLN